jgi:hypothetical protein
VFFDDLDSGGGDTVQAPTQWQHPVASKEGLDTCHIKQFKGHHTGASPWPAKWPSKALHFFVLLFYVY